MSLYHIFHVQERILDYCKAQKCNHETQQKFHGLSFIPFDGFYSGCVGLKQKPSMIINIGKTSFQEKGGETDE